MSSEFVARVLKAENLPSLPNVAVEVLRLTRDDNVSVDELARVIQNDPALSGKLLRVVNSAMFGLPREVGSIKQSMVILGLRTVKVMALSFSVVDALSARGSGEFDMESYWRRSLITAIAARLIARSVSPRYAEEAFVAGLLCDIGMIAAWRCASEPYAAVLATVASTGARLWEVEVERLGASHAQLSAAMLKKWNLPDVICSAVAAHHGEGLSASAGGPADMSRIVYAAALIAGVFCQDVSAGELAAVKSRCQALTGIAPATLEHALTDLDNYAKETASLLSLEIGATTTYAQLQAEAATQLAQLSVQAEVDRAVATRRASQAETDVSRLSKENERILEAASTDALTKVANRAEFDKRLREELERAAETGHAVGLIMMDVDHFKQFNDTHGHLAGDTVLREVAAAMRDTARAAQLVARFGGEEFAVIVAQSAAAEIRGLAEQIRAAIATREIRHDGKSLHVTASFGAAQVTPAQGPMPPEKLVALADQRLYQAKRAGRNRVEFVDAPRA